MGPKRKADPEALSRQWEQFQISDECTEWRELQKLKREYPDISLSNDYPDLVGSFQQFHDKMFKFAISKFKVKTRLKEIKHEHVRSGFLAKENFIETEKEKEVYWVDGMRGGVTKESSDKAYHIQRIFKTIWRSIDAIDDYDENNFVAERKQFIKDMSEFYKLIAPHIKAGHKEIYDEKLLTELLLPL